MSMVGEQVKHIRFGEGTVTEIVDNKLEIRFAEEAKQFLYPDGFETFLKFADGEAQKRVEKELKARKKVQEEEQKRLTQHRRTMIKINRTKASASTHAVFHMDEAAWQEFQKEWKVFFGLNRTGKMKGQPKIPVAVNMNSACLITIKDKEEEEENRMIAGIFMPQEDFIGENCTDGWVPAHEELRIAWPADQEKLYFWSLFPEHLRMNKWGNVQAKFISTKSMKCILFHMEQSSTGEVQKQIKDFYQYFTELND